MVQEKRWSRQYCAWSLGDGLVSCKGSKPYVMLDPDNYRPRHIKAYAQFLTKSFYNTFCLFVRFFCEPAREVVSHPTWWIRSLLARTVVPLGNPRPLLLRPYYSDWDTRLPHPLLVVKTWTPRFSQFARKATRMCTLPRPGPARSGMHI